MIDADTMRITLVPAPGPTPDVDPADIALTLLLAVAGALWATAIILTAATSGWTTAIAPLVCTVVAYAGIRALWARGTGSPWPSRPGGPAAPGGPLAPPR